MQSQMPIFRSEFELSLLRKNCIPFASLLGFRPILDYGTGSKIPFISCFSHVVSNLYKVQKVRSSKKDSYM